MTNLNGKRALATGGARSNVAAIAVVLTSLAGAGFAQEPSTAEPASEASPLAVLQTILSNIKANPDGSETDI